MQVSKKRCKEIKPNEFDSHNRIEKLASDMLKM